MEIKELQNKCLEITLVFKEFCEKHGLLFYLCGGGCIGAIRHHGFIPWDDDVDVEMEYGDYKRLLKLLRSHPIEGYILQDKHSDEEYVLNFAKLRDLHSNIEEYAGQDAHWQFRGCYIDIFPLLPSSSLWLHKRGLNIHNRLVHRHMRIEDERMRRFKIAAGRRVFDCLAFPILRLLGSIGAGRCRRHIPGGAYHFRRDADDFREGIPMFVKGFFKKVVLANVIGSLHTQILAMGMSNISAMTAWLGALAYTLQIFNDFSGYSDMAIGLGRMLGFEFPKNFDRPYASSSVTEFWRRWHISLGTWFREYVYIPLGGNRKGVKRQIINLLIVWALTGLWHGASWNFVIWGLYYGILLIFEKFVYVHLQKRLPKFLNVVITFIVVIIGWVFFFSNNMTEAVSYLKAMFGQSGCSHDGMGGFLLLNNLVMIILAWIPSVFDFKEGKKKSPLKWVLCIMVFLITIAFLVSESYNPFLYFRF